MNDFLFFYPILYRFVLLIEHIMIQNNFEDVKNSAQENNPVAW